MPSSATTAHFSKPTINARPAAYYSIDGVTQAVTRAMQDAADDLGYQYLVKDDGRIVGRVNLSGVRRAHFHSAVLGYRIGEAACGKGYAGEAVRQVLGIAFGELGLARIEADCRVENAGSVRVLLRNGFSAVRTFAPQFRAEWRVVRPPAFRMPRNPERRDVGWTAIPGG